MRSDTIHGQVKPGEAQTARQYRQIVSGPESVTMAEKLRAERAKDRKIAWPYPWDFAPPGAVPVKEANSIAAPTNNTLTLVTTHSVPDGMIFCLRAVLLNADVGTMWVPGSGSITFSITINRPGAGNAQGIVLKDFGAVITPLGSFDAGPWPIPGTQMAEFEALSTIRIMVTTTNAITPGAPQYIHGILVGYEYLA